LNEVKSGTELDVWQCRSRVSLRSTRACSGSGEIGQQIGQIGWRMMNFSFILMALCQTEIGQNWLEYRKRSASVARIERSEIRDGARHVATPIPGFAALNPGYACWRYPRASRAGRSFAADVALP